MKMLFSALLLLGCLCATSQLSKSQLKMTNSYFEVIANHPRYVRFLNQEIAELKLESSNLKAALQPSDSTRISTLVYSIDTFEQVSILPDSVSLHINRINDYIQTYYEIIPNGFSVYKALKGTTETIGGVFGVGGLIGAILPKREPGLSAKKKKRLRHHLQSSEQVFLDDLHAIQIYMEAAFLPALNELDQNTSKDFQSLMEEMDEHASPMDYYTKHNRLITRFYQKMILAKNLTHQLIHFMKILAQAEQELQSRIQEKQKVDLIDTHFNQLVVEVSKINTSLKTLQDIKFR